jgi:predicted transcriptional regulator
MTSKALQDVIERVESWPSEAQDELAQIVREMESAMQGQAYRPSVEELAGIDRGLKAAREGRFASDTDVEAVFVKHRPR